MFDEIKKVLAAEKRGEKISLQEVCKLNEKLAAMPLLSLTRGQLMFHGKYQIQLRNLRDKLVESLQEELDENH